MGKSYYSHRISIYPFENTINIKNRVKKLSERLNLPIIHSMNVSNEFILVVHDNRVELFNNTKKMSPLTVDFSSRKFLNRISQPSKNTLIGRAIGIGKSENFIVDLTAGLGRDTVQMACMGHRVVAIERDPIVFTLLEDGVERARTENFLSEDIIERISIKFGDSFSYLADMSNIPSIAYIDPMYSIQRKSALPNYEMQILNSLIGPGDEFEISRLINSALIQGIPKVVVKRSKNIPRIKPLQDRAPNFSIIGTTICFDIYQQ
ncbi:MAG: class I SAM-dependent methyltransferase [Dehalococcoidia bacterium]